ncbi:MAG: o-succinylbenzoate synthase [Pseudomonadota bacterium]
MPISAYRLIPYSLPLRQVWRTNRDSVQQRQGWIIELATDSGLKGHGDCAPLPAAGTETAPAAETCLTSQLPLLQNQSPTDALQRLPSSLQNPAARHALETALLDLVSQSEHLSLRQWLSPTAVDEIAVNGSGGALDEQVFTRADDLLSLDFQSIKLKVGLYAVDQEIHQLKQLSAQLPAAIRLRLDANGAWSMTQAREFLRNLSGLPIESLEEPLKEPRLDNLRELQNMTEVSLALDESLSRLALEELLEQPPVRRLIIKPCVLGGLLPAKRLADLARQADLETVVTSTLESAVGIQAAAQLAMAINPLDQPLAHGLATSAWFANDVAEPPTIAHGRLWLANIAGLGIQLKPGFTHHQPG